MIIMERTRHISAVDKIDNLRTFVKQDLRDMGIKLPKTKKAKKLNNSRAFSQDGLLAASGIFGNFLAHVPCEYISGCGYVPKFLVDAADHIKKNVDLEGIFRKSGVVSRQKELKQQTEEGKELDVSNVNDLTGLIKQFFRELPEPLFTSLYHDSFIKCYQLANDISVTSAILLLCLLLPAEHLSTLQFIMQLFGFIAKHCDQNKMDAANLAVVMAPNLMHVNSKSEKMNSTEEKLLQIQTSIVELLVKNADCIGMISESLYQRQALMTECFGTDDELDASGDNTLEDSKDVKKKEKKRKRSGSFQGLVSTIANGLAKLRRSTDGKNVSTTQPGTAHNNESTQSLPSRLEHASHHMVTPVVIRKRKVSGDVPFSASKKKAILQHLPQQATLASTPFTPGIGRRKKENDARKMGVLNTPSITFGETSQLPFTATPCPDIKTSRKKLNLFSPLSSKKLKRTPSGANLSTQSAKKQLKAKNIFRRMSGGKADKVEETSQIGERLASPKGVSEDDYGFIDHNGVLVLSPKRESPIAAITLNSPSLLAADSSVISRFDDTQMLNEGFIVDANTLDTDQTANSCYPLTRSYSLYANTRSSRADIPRGRKPHKRSLSADGSSSSENMQILRRGQPNTIKNGLLKGEQQQLKKLRKSFERPEISAPIPIIVPPVSEEAGNLKVFESKEAMLKAASNRTLNGSLTNVILPPPNQFADEAQAMEYDSDESEAGFSTISGGTVIHVPILSSSSLKSNASSKSSGSSVSNMISASQQNLPSALHSSNSTDSLLSSSSIDSVESNRSNLQRCLSSDSGQGSLLDYTAGVVQADSDQKESLDVAFIETDSIIVDRSIQRGPNISLSSGQIASHNPNRSLQNTVKKSNSANQLAPAPSYNVARSQSMYMQTSRRHNIKPNILISADTHKILARAGYLANTPDADSAQDYKLPVKTPPKSSIADYSKNCSQLSEVSVMSTSISSCAANRTCHLDKEPETNNTKKDLLHNTLQQAGTDQNCRVVIKRAQMLIPKHDSIANIQVNQAGKVAGNVRQFMDSTSVDVAERHRSPFRFPNSTSRRGVSPIRIPTIFARNDKHAAQLRELALLAKEKSEALKRLQSLSRDPTSASKPVDTQQISVNCTAEDPQMASSTCSEGAPSLLEECVGSSSSISSLTANLSSVKEKPGSGQKVESVFKQPGIDVCVSIEKRAAANDNKNQASVIMSSINDSKNVTFGGVNVDLSSSLIATIHDVCTPKGKKLVRSPLADRGNCDGDTATPITDTIQLRMANGMTPRQIMKFCQLTPRDKHRSPGKPVKRLGSPGSPCRGSLKRKSHSPHKGTSSVLCSVPSHLQTSIEEM
ncbi:uncharacterized protein LOC121370398 [Gigantopelta aegis]|uniref:uncharacterized protein LOC121370398 n=1 Tax=Gigantopelta aegis TaxID=1735272 RepID=UPI001B88C921|nr:uncharacterized protein LOC121370398 [Gigantopelta aegis]